MVDQLMHDAVMDRRVTEVIGHFPYLCQSRLEACEARLMVQIQTLNLTRTL